MKFLQDEEKKVARLIADIIEMTPTYSLFKSKTFWTIVFQFVYNGFLAISGELNPTTLLVGNALLSALASYFHLQTGNSTTGTNA